MDIWCQHARSHGTERLEFVDSIYHCWAHANGSDRYGRTLQAERSWKARSRAQWQSSKSVGSLQSSRMESLLTVSSLLKYATRWAPSIACWSHIIRGQHQPCCFGFENESVESRQYLKDSRPRKFWLFGFPLIYRICNKFSIVMIGLALAFRLFLALALKLPFSCWVYTSNQEQDLRSPSGLFSDSSSTKYALQAAFFF